MCITKEELRAIVSEEIRIALVALLDAKTTATAIQMGQYYSEHALLLSHNKLGHRRKSS